MKLLFCCIMCLLMMSACENQTSNPDNIQNPMLEAVNQLRSEGCNCNGELMPPAPAYTWNNKLEIAAIRHVKDMENNNHFNHKGTDGSSFGERIKDAGYFYSLAAENIAKGSTTVNAVMKQWISSSPHCKNIMNAKYTEFAAAKVGTYWVQVFAK